MKSTLGRREQLDSVAIEDGKTVEVTLSSVKKMAMQDCKPDSESQLEFSLGNSQDLSCINSSSLMSLEIKRIS
jgi:hypothetical protein